MARPGHRYPRQGTRRRTNRTRYDRVINRVRQRLRRRPRRRRASPRTNSGRVNTFRNLIIRPIVRPYLRVLNKRTASRFSSRARSKRTHGRQRNGRHNVTDVNGRSRSMMVTNLVDLPYPGRTSTCHRRAESHTRCQLTLGRSRGGLRCHRRNQGHGNRVRVTHNRRRCSRRRTKRRKFSSTAQTASNISSKRVLTFVTNIN